MKCSIGFVCLRSDQRKYIQITVILKMALVATVSVGGIIFVLVNCDLESLEAGPTKA
jgi:hypothetical protein